MILAAAQAVDDTERGEGHRSADRNACVLGDEGEGESGRLFFVLDIVGGHVVVSQGVHGLFHIVFQI